MCVDRAEIVHCERAQEKEEDVSKVHLRFVPEHNKKHGSLNEDEDRTHVAGKSVVLEFDSHVLCSFGMPF